MLYFIQRKTLIFLFSSAVFAAAPFGLNAMNQISKKPNLPQEENGSDQISEKRTTEHEIFNVLEKANPEALEQFFKECKENNKETYINDTNSKGRTPLIVSIMLYCTKTYPNYADYIKSLTLLLDNGADVNQPDKNGTLPFASAVFLDALHNTIEATQLLHKFGADINKAEKDSDTPIHRSTWVGNTEVTTFLLANGAKKTVNATTINNWSALHKAIDGNLIILLENGALKSINTISSERRITPLYFKAISNQDVEHTKLLIYLGAKITDELKQKIKNERGMLQYPIIVNLINGSITLKDCCTQEEFKKFFGIRCKALAALAHEHNFLGDLKGDNKIFKSEDINFNYLSF